MALSEQFPDVSAALAGGRDGFCWVWTGIQWFAGAFTQSCGVFRRQEIPVFNSILNFNSNGFLFSFILWRRFQGVLFWMCVEKTLVYLQDAFSEKQIIWEVALWGFELSWTRPPVQPLISKSWFSALFWELNLKKNYIKWTKAALLSYFIDLAVRELEGFLLLLCIFRKITSF